MTDSSNGYEAVAAEFLAGRGRAPFSAIGARAVRDWDRTLPSRATVIDRGCGSGLPITKVLVGEGLTVYAIDAAESLVAAFRHNLPGIPIACESVEVSPFFDRTFDGVVAWGLMFLLLPEAQRRLIRSIADISGTATRGQLTAPDKRSATPHELERPVSEEAVRETHAHHRGSLRRARRNPGGRRRVPRAAGW
jgi:hypothetical protein